MPTEPRQGRQRLAQCASTGKMSSYRPAPERGERLPTRPPISTAASMGTSSSRLSLSRFEAHFNLGAHFDGVAALDRRLITKLRPRHSLTELRAGFELGDFPFRVDDHFATDRSPRGLPKGCRLNGGALNQKGGLFVSRNGDIGD